MSDENVKQLRVDSIKLYRLQASNALDSDAHAWQQAIRATVGACIGIEDHFVLSGNSRRQAQNKASALLGQNKVRKILFAMHEILAQQ